MQLSMYSNNWRNVNVKLLHRVYTKSHNDFIFYILTSSSTLYKPLATIALWEGGPDVCMSLFGMDWTMEHDSANIDYPIGLMCWLYLVPSTYEGLSLELHPKMAG